MSLDNRDARHVAEALRLSGASMRGGALSFGDALAAAEQVGVELTRSVWRELALRDRYGKFVPHGLVMFVARIAASNGSSAILNLWSGDGEVALALSKARPAALVTAIEPDPSAIEVGRHFDADNSVSWIHGRPNDIDDLGLLAATEFDFMVLTPPFGLPKKRLKVGSSSGQRLEVFEEEGRLDLVAFEPRLSQTGSALLLTSTTILSSTVAEKYRQALAERGLWLQSAISLPAGTFAPYTSMPAVLAMLGRDEQNDVFMAELPETDEGQLRLIDAMSARRRGRTPEAGVLVAVGDLAPLSAVVARFDVEQGLKATGMDIVTLGDIASLSRADRNGDSYSFQPADNSLYLPLAGFGAARLEPPDKITPNWAQVALDPDVAVAPYVARWLSTALGKRSRESLAAGMTVQHLRMDSAEALPVALPPLEEQYRCLSLDAELVSVASDVQQMRDDLWVKPRRINEIDRKVRRLCPDDDMSNWIQTLPLPLSTVAQAYFAKRNDRVKVDSLFHFFEATAEFSATILLSALASDPGYLLQERDALLGTPEERRRYFEKASLGGWTTLALRLSKELRRQLSSGKADAGPGRDAVLRWFGGPSEGWIDMITDCELYGTLDDARKRRNDWKGHGGAAGDGVIRSQLAQLEELLALVRAKIADRWMDVRLVSPTGQMVFNEGVFESTVDVLMGATFPFRQDVVFTSDPLESNRLHLVHQNARSSMQLLPLVRMMPSPRTEANTCYFYNRVEGAEVRYVSYYYEEDPETSTSRHEVASGVVLDALGLTGD